MASGDLAAHLYDQVISILTKDSSQRTETEIIRILPWFQKKSDLFKSLRTGIVQKEKIVQDIVKNCKFESVEKDTVIIKQGDKGDCFYIILSGIVSILINTTFGSDEDQTDEQTNAKAKSKEEKAEKKLDRSIFGNFVGKIESGKSFGELALINADCVRNATIIADETTDLVVVNRELYNRSLHSFQAKEFEERKNFVESNPMFSNWQPKYKKQMAMSLRKEKVMFDAPILRQGTPVDGLCFLLSGQAKIISESGMHPVQYPSYFPLADIEDLEKVEARESLRRELCMPSPKPEEVKPISRQRSPVQDSRVGKKSPCAHRHVEICLIGALEIIGDLELITGLQTYSQSVVCTQEAEIYILDQKNYDRLIEKRNPQVIEMIKELVRTKYALRLSWVHDKEIPFIRYLLYKIEEKERQKRLKNTQKNTPSKDSPLEWNSVDSLHMGPVIDMYGPGSVFHSIRMKDKQRKLEKIRFGQHSRGPKSTNSNTQSLNNAYSQAGMITQLVNQEKLPNEEEQDDIENNQEEESDGLNDDIKPKSHLICENGKQSKSDAKQGVVGETFQDWESSDDALSSLEKRIEAWHSSLPPEESKRRNTKKAVKLHRLYLEENVKPLPGKKVFLRPKIKHKSTFLEDLKNEHSNADERKPMYRSPIIEVHTPRMSEKESMSASSVGKRCCRTRRPLSSRSEPVFFVRKKRLKSARQYTAAEYEALKEELRQKQRAFKSLLGRPKF